MNKPNFVWDKDKMIDYRDLSKEEFLKSYSYLTEEEYDNTTEILTPDMCKIINELLNSSIPYGKVTVEIMDDCTDAYAIYVDGLLYEASLNYYEVRSRLMYLNEGYKMNDRVKRESVIKEREYYIDMFWKYLEDASPEIMAGYYLFDYGDEAYSRWVECAEEFEPAEREIITNIISKLGRED